MRVKCLCLGVLAFSFVHCDLFKPTKLYVGSIRGQAFVQGDWEYALANLRPIESDGSLGEVIANAATDSSGWFSILTWFEDEAPECMAVEVSYGQYQDTATELENGRVLTPTGKALYSIICDFADHFDAPIAVSPLSHMATTRALQLISEGIPTRSAINTSITTVSQQYGIGSVTQTFPVDVTIASEVQVANTDRRNHGIVLAGLSLLATTNGLNTVNFAAALGSDSSDGILDDLRFGSAITVDATTFMAAPLPPNSATEAMQVAIDTFIGMPSNYSNLDGHAIVSDGQPLGISTNGELSITSTVLPAWTDGEAGTGFLGVEGGTPPYTWSVEPSTLPPGFSLDPNTGEITGTGGLSPGSAMSISPPYVFTVTDATGATKQLHAVITMVQPPPTLTLFPPATLTQGVPYDSPIASTEGPNGPYYCTIATGGGFPPLGMVITPDCRLRGTPAGSGNFSFSVCVVDLVGAQTCSEENFTGTIEEGEEPEPTTGFDGGYTCSVHTVTPIGVTDGTGTFSCSGGYCSDPDAVFTGTVSSSGSFTGTSYVCDSCTALVMTGTFSTTSAFTISGSSETGAVSQSLTCTQD